MSHSAEAPVRPRGGVAAVLDVVFGLFVWAVHLVAIYVATAVSCQLGLGAADASGRAALRWTLVVATLIAATLAGVHALRRWQRYRDQPARRFRMALTIGCDAIAGVAILWQLVAVALVPACR